MFNEKHGGFRQHYVRPCNTKRSRLEDPAALLLIGVTWKGHTAGEADGGGQQRHGEAGGDRHREDGAPPDGGPHQVPGLRSETESVTVVAVPDPTTGGV